MDSNYNDYKEMVQKARRQLRQTRKKLGNNAQLEDLQNVVDSISQLLKENKKLMEQKERLKLKLADMKKQRDDMKMLKEETLKLSSMIIRRLMGND